MRPDKPWTPQRLSEIRVEAGFASQRQLSIKSKVDQQTISRIEAGGNISIETSEKLAPFLGIEHPALFVAHNLANTTTALVKGYMSLAEAKRDRNYIEQVLTQTNGLPPEQYKACETTLEQLNEVISELNKVRHNHTGIWPGADDPGLTDADMSGQPLATPVRPASMASPAQTQ